MEYFIGGFEFWFEDSFDIEIFLFRSQAIFFKGYKLLIIEDSKLKLCGYWAYDIKYLGRSIFKDLKTSN